MLDPARDPRVAAYRRQSGRTVHAVAAATLESPPVQALWNWWQSAAAAGRLPHRRQFDVAEYPMLAAHLFLVEPASEGYGLRLAGESFVDLFRRNRGHVWRRAGGSPLDSVMVGYFDFVREAGRPFRSTGSLTCSWADFFSFESLLCPVEDDQAGTMLMGAAARVDDGDDAGEIAL
jgi:hypothetical protein